MKTPRAIRYGGTTYEADATVGVALSDVESLEAEGWILIVDEQEAEAMGLDNEDEER